MNEFKWNQITLMEIKIAEENMKSYSKIETLLERDPATFKVIEGKYKDPNITDETEWYVEEKVDGTNVRIIWDGEKLEFKGREENSQLSVPLTKWLKENVDPERFKEEFGNRKVVVYGEGYGKGIQKVGPLYGDEQKFIMFDVLNTEDDSWASRQELKEIGKKLGLDVVKQIESIKTTAEAIKGAKEGFSTLEGYILRSEKDPSNRCVYKIKQKDFVK